MKDDQVGGGQVESGHGRGRGRGRWAGEAVKWLLPCGAGPAPIIFAILAFSLFWNCLECLNYHFSFYSLCAVWTRRRGLVCFNSSLALVTFPLAGSVNLWVSPLSETAFSLLVKRINWKHFWKRLKSDHYFCTSFTFFEKKVVFQ